LADFVEILTECTLGCETNGKTIRIPGKTPGAAGPPEVGQNKNKNTLLRLKTLDLDKLTYDFQISTAVLSGTLPLTLEK